MSHLSLFSLHPDGFTFWITKRTFSTHNVHCQPINMVGDLKCYIQALQQSHFIQMIALKGLMLKGCDLILEDQVHPTADFFLTMLPYTTMPLYTILK